jgi:hypothetical protein
MVLLSEGIGSAPPLSLPLILRSRYGGPPYRDHHFGGVVVGTAAVMAEYLLGKKNK